MKPMGPPPVSERMVVVCVVADITRGDEGSVLSTTDVDPAWARYVKYMHTERGGWRVSGGAGCKASAHVAWLCIPG
jgi:hypothetical protein